MDTLLLIWFLQAVVCAFACAMIANSKNLNGTSWFFGGLFFGIIALIVVAVSEKRETKRWSLGAATEKAPWKCSKCGYVNSYWVEKCENRITDDAGRKVLCDNPLTPEVPTEKKCPMCAEMVKYEAKICRFCQYKFTD